MAWFLSFFCAPRVRYLLLNKGSMHHSSFYSSLSGGFWDNSSIASVLKRIFLFYFTHSFDFLYFSLFIPRSFLCSKSYRLLLSCALFLGSTFYRWRFLLTQCLLFYCSSSLLQIYGFFKQSWKSPVCFWRVISLRLNQIKGWSYKTP